MNDEDWLANEAWEALFRAQVMLARELAADGTWIELSSKEYDVLYTVSRAPRGLTMAEMNHGILLTQAGLSRLVSGLVERGLLVKTRDENDGRATRLTLTEAGRAAQRAVGRRHGAAIARAMTEALDHDELEQLRDLGRKIISSVSASGGRGNGRAQGGGA